MDDKLNWKEKLELTVQTGLQLVPYIGGALSSAYFGTKQEKRFKRIESFYEELAEQVNSSQMRFPSIESHNIEMLTQLIEELNEKIEREHSQQKREYFKQFLMISLLEPTNEHNFDERRFFLDSLGNMTNLDCELLSFVFHQREPVRVGQINKPGVDHYAIVGTIGRLKTYGFLQSTTDMIGFGGDNALNDLVSISSFGRSFVHYCME